MIARERRRARGRKKRKMHQNPVPQPIPPEAPAQPLTVGENPLAGIPSTVQDTPSVRRIPANIGKRQLSPVVSIELIVNSAIRSQTPIPTQNREQESNVKSRNYGNIIRIGADSRTTAKKSSRQNTWDGGKFHPHCHNKSIHSVATTTDCECVHDIIR